MRKKIISIKIDRHSNEMSKNRYLTALGITPQIINDFINNGNLYLHNIPPQTVFSEIIGRLHTSHAANAVREIFNNLPTKLKVYAFNNILKSNNDIDTALNNYLTTKGINHYQITNVIDQSSGRFHTGQKICLIVSIKDIKTGKSHEIFIKNHVTEKDRFFAGFRQIMDRPNTNEVFFNKVMVCDKIDDNYALSSTILSTIEEKKLPVLNADYIPVLDKLIKELATEHALSDTFFRGDRQLTNLENNNGIFGNYFISKASQKNINAIGFDFEFLNDTDKWLIKDSGELKTELAILHFLPQDINKEQFYQLYRQTYIDTVKNIKTKLSQIEKLRKNTNALQVSHYNQKMLSNPGNYIDNQWQLSQKHKYQ